MEVEQSPCSHCSELVDSSKLHLHEAYCRRNRVQCEICQKFYDKEDEEEHAELHEKVKCEFCSKEFMAEQYETHKLICDSQPKTCSFCNVLFAINEYTNHVYMCGSRSKICDIC